MAFWDTSAIIPLIWSESDTARREAQLAENPAVIVWYGTLAEIDSAFSRRLREGILSDSQVNLARKKIAVLSRAWIEVDPTMEVRERAIRLLRIHSLRTGDAFQLAAALLVFSERPTGHQFRTADLRLSDAAQREGFDVS